ncbi:MULTISPECIES: hypothetical protein [unclassified Myroides]|uniref:hypothetical protein n=1 Tax=unclassified Myroides TaxID=2642485 RepID=UPI003D2F5B19
MKNNICLLLILFFVISCNKKKEYYENGGLYKVYYQKSNFLHGKYEEYYPTQNLKILSYYVNGKIGDSIVEFYDTPKLIVKSIQYNLKEDSIKKVFYSKEGKKLEEGILYKHKRIGEWNFYDDDQVSKKLEYLIVNGEQYVNQGWYYDKEGKIRKNIGNHIKIEMKSDTVNVNEIVKVLITLEMPLFSFDSDVVVYIPKDYTHELKSDYSNFYEIEMDTLLSLKNEKRQKEYNSYNLQVLTALKFSKRGQYNFRGVLQEIHPNYENSGIDLNLNDSIARKIYFNKTIYVK